MFLILFAILIIPTANAVSGVTIGSPIVDDISRYQIPGYLLKPYLTVDTSASPGTVETDKPSTITVTVKDSNGTAVNGAMVKLTTSGGAVKENAGFTNAQGRFTTTFQSSTAGTFTINATASYSGYSDTLKTVQVTIPNKPPTAAFKATPPSGTEPLVVTFDASGSKDVDGTIAAYDWDFGDGDKGTGQTAEHNYTLNGTYAAVLTVTDNLGAKNTYTSQMKVDKAASKGFDLSQIDPAVLMVIVAVVLVILLIVIIILFLWLRTKLKIVPKVTTAPADGKTVIPVKVMFVNGFGGTKRSGRDVEVEIKATAGTVKNVVLAGSRDFVETELVAPKEFGASTITATAGNKSASAVVNFTYKSATFEVSASPDTIPADGKSSATVTVRIKNENGDYIAPIVDRSVDLKATLGTIGGPVKYPAKAPSVSATITSGEVSGTAVISAASGDIKGEGKVAFGGLPKRFCMHCGSSMSMEAAQCPKCGLTPPSGVDTKPCATCATVLPEPAKFCYKCGARQADIKK